MWSAESFAVAFPIRSRPASCSPVPPGPWSRNASSGWKPNVRFQVGVAPSFSECARTIGPRGETGGLSCQTRSRACARACRSGRSVGCQRRDEPRRGRVGGDLPEQVGLRPHDCQVGQAVATECNSDRKVQHNLARVVTRLGTSPRPQRGRQGVIQTCHGRGLQQRAARRADE